MGIGLPAAGPSFAHLELVDADGVAVCGRLSERCWTEPMGDCQLRGMEVGASLGPLSLIVGVE